MNSETKPRRLLRRCSVLDRVCLSKTELHRRIKSGTFPAPIKIGARSVAWTESSIDSWIASLICSPAEEESK